MSVVTFESVKQARANFADLNEAAAQGRPANFRRNNQTIALVDLDRLVRDLAILHPADAITYREDDAVGLAIRELGLAVEADTLDGAVIEMIGALRDYAEDWSDHLRHAPNHAQHWGVVQVIVGSDDARLADWVLGKIQ